VKNKTKKTAKSGQKQRDLHLAKQLLRDAAEAIPGWITDILDNSHLSKKKQVARIMEILGDLSELFDEYPPQPYWWRAFLQLTGEHWVCVGEDAGWIPAADREDQEIIDEVNAPIWPSTPEESKQAKAMYRHLDRLDRRKGRDLPGIGARIDLSQSMRDAIERAAKAIGPFVQKEWERLGQQGPLQSGTIGVDVAKNGLYVVVQISNEDGTGERCYMKFGDAYNFAVAVKQMATEVSINTRSQDLQKQADETRRRLSPEVSDAEVAADLSRAGFTDEEVAAEMAAQYTPPSEELPAWSDLAARATSVEPPAPSLEPPSFEQSYEAHRTAFIEGLTSKGWSLVDATREFEAQCGNE
jgi:hypothetical protein